MAMRILEVTQGWACDVDELRLRYGQSLALDEVEDDDDVVTYCFENGVREPYFELVTTEMYVQRPLV